jgi:polysaccharide export outer membrane protein
MANTFLGTFLGNAALAPLRSFGLRLLGALLALLFAQAAMAQAPAAAQPSSPGYVLGPNDGLSIVVYGQNEFNVSTRVKPDGSIVVPLIGKVQAQGKTVLTLADEVTRRLIQGNFLRDPIVNVEVTEYASKYVRVAGKVGAPGLVPLDRYNGLLDVLLRAGWVQDVGSELIYVRRAGSGQEIEISTKDLARGTVADVVLQPGDTIYVPPSEVVYLTGAAMAPGSYPLKRDMTVSDLLAMAGGVGPTGSSGKFGLKRGDEKEVDAAGSDKLQAGDVIRVRERLF